MTDIDLSTLSLEELKSLQRKVTKAIDEFSARRIAEARRQIEEVAASHGLKLSEILGHVDNQKRPPAPPKYQHPTESDTTWSGRGRKPSWIVEGLAAGKSLDDFLI